MRPSLLRKARKLARTADEEASLQGELNVVPFLDIVTNLVLFLLATVTSALTVTQVDAQLTQTGRGAPPTNRASVTVTVAETGIFVSSPVGRVGAGCDVATAGAAPTIARGEHGHDFRALSRCLARVLDATDVVSTDVILSASANVPYQDVISAMDAVRADGDRPLFDDVLLAAGVR